MASLDGFKAAALSLVLIAMIIAGGAIALDSFQEDLILAEATTTINNESVTLANATAVNLANNWVASITEVYVNETGAWVILPSANYTLGNGGTSLAGTITLSDNSKNGNVSRVTYTYYDDEALVQTNTTGEGLAGIANATSYLSVIGTLLGVAAIISVVLGAFYMFRR